MRIRQHTLLTAVGAVLAASLMLTGCQSNPTGMTGAAAEEPVSLPALVDVLPHEDPSNAAGPTHALIGAPTFKAIADEPETDLPVTVISKDLDGGRPEIVVGDVSRIIAISITGTLADYVTSLGFGENLIAKDIATSAPGTEDLPVITGNGHTINLESVLALQPTLILTDGTIGPDDMVRIKLREAGIPVVAVDRISDFESSYEAARDVATTLGVPALGEELAAGIETSIDAKIAEIQATLLPDDEEKLPRVVFLYLRGTSGIFFMFGEGSGIDSVLEAVGVVDIATELGWKGQRPLTPEALPAMNPDAILVMSNGLDSVGGVDGLIAGIPGVAQTKAGQNRRIIDVDDTLIFSGGTRTADVLDGVARALFAPDSLQNL